MIKLGNIYNKLNIIHILIIRLTKPEPKPQSRTEVKTLIFMAIISGRGQIFVVPVRIFGLEPVYHTG